MFGSRGRVRPAFAAYNITGGKMTEEKIHIRINFWLEDLKHSITIRKPSYNLRALRKTPDSFFLTKEQFIELKKYTEEYKKQIEEITETEEYKTIKEKIKTLYLSYRNHLEKVQEENRNR